ncbi:MAG: GNAT family N-acetyltransferase [Bacteroidota bacterium]
MLNIEFKIQPILETERLILRQQTISDAAALFALRTNPQVMRYIDRNSPKDIRESEAAIQAVNAGLSNGSSLIWAITLKTSPNKMVGNVGFWRTDLFNHRAELGYMLLPDHWRNGILSEALASVLNFGFKEMGLHSICANINPDNNASRQLLIKHSFVKEAYFRQDYYFNGKFLDSEIYGLLNNTV